MAKRHDAFIAINASGFNDETGRGGGKEATEVVIENGRISKTNQDDKLLQ
ncbi:hypothetical protein ATL10_10544 [Bacillus sp. 196mf]|nr:hypothetical protein ATL10_10544 [Bacillus sp. 196mf]